MSLTARDIAVKALRDRDGNVTAHLDRLLNDCEFASNEKGLAREITLGVVRRKATLTAIMRAYLRSPKQKLPRPIGEIILVALYQIIFLERVPAFAAVDQAVRQASAFKHKRQAGLVNGLLRTVIREMAAPTPVALSPEPAVEMLRMDNDTQRRFDRAIFRDPETLPIDYLAAMCSIPHDLAKRWFENFKLKKALRIGLDSCARPPIICRVNTFKSTVATVIDMLAEDGVTATRHENSVSVILDSAANLQSLRAFSEGLIQPQDPTATSVGLKSGALPGMRVLDLCAAPGTKTTHLAELMQNQGEIIAVDVSNSKLKRIEENAQRMGFDIIKTMHAEKVGSLDVNSFDLVLADVPCSNTGVLARRGEARWRFTQKSIGELVRAQQFLSLTAAQFVKPGGTLIYSTCSIEKDEGPRVAKGIHKRVPQIRFLKDKLTLPETSSPVIWHDGGYFALLKG